MLVHDGLGLARGLFKTVKREWKIEVVLTTATKEVGENVERIALLLTICMGLESFLKKILVKGMVVEAGFVRTSPCRSYI